MPLPTSSSAETGADPDETPDATLPSPFQASAWDRSPAALLGETGPDDRPAPPLDQGRGGTPRLRAAHPSARGRLGRCRAPGPRGRCWRSHGWSAWSAGSPPTAAPTAPLGRCSGSGADAWLLAHGAHIETQHSHPERSPSGADAARRLRDLPRGPLGSGLLRHRRPAWGRARHRGPRGHLRHRRPAHRGARLDLVGAAVAGARLRGRVRDGRPRRWARSAARVGRAGAAVALLVGRHTSGAPRRRRHTAADPRAGRRGRRRIPGPPWQ